MRSSRLSRKGLCVAQSLIWSPSTCCTASGHHIPGLPLPEASVCSTSEINVYHQHFGGPWSLGLAASYAKGRETKTSDRKHGKHQHGAAQRAASATAVGEEIEEFSIEPFHRLMRAALDHFQLELGKQRGGRAVPGMLEPVLVGGHSELKNLGTVTARGANLLVVNVYNPQDLETVAAAVRSSPLQLQARVEGKEVLVPVPRMTLEMVERLVKLVGQEGERAKVSVRHARGKALEAARRAPGSDQELQRTEREIQKLHDEYIAKIERLRDLKDKDLRENH